MAHGPRGLNLVTIRIIVRIQESEVRNPDSLDYRITNGFWWNFRDQLITFWWRSASLSGSGSPFLTTILIREELPQFYYAGVRRRSVLSEYFLRNRRWGGCVYVLQSVFFDRKKMRQPFSGTAERIFMKLLPNDTGENGVCNVVPPPDEWRMLSCWWFA